MANAPSLLERLCPECGQHFHLVQQTLTSLEVPFSLNRFMVRGLDYYTRTTFEFLTTGLGAQAAVGAGGRYDGLIEQLGGPPLSGIGFAMGMERIALLMEQQATPTEPLATMDIFLAALGVQPLAWCGQLAHQLRRHGLKVALDYSGRSLKAQLKLANRVRARFALIIGDDELQRQEGTLRNMTSQEQQPLPLPTEKEHLCTELVRLIKSGVSSR